MIRLSACIIAKDEEKHIGQCLESVNNVADELIVVDTGSGDRTVAIAKAAGAKIHNLKWQDDFSLARNHALNQARGEWVLQLDADERLYEQDPRLFGDLLNNQGVDAYACQIVNLVNPDNFDGAVINGYNRLFRRHAFRYTGVIHEQLQPTSFRRGMSGFADIHILHLGYLDPKIQKSKANRNHSLLTKAIELSPHEPELYYYLGREQVQAGRLEEAVDAFNEAEALRTGGAVGFLALIVVERCRCLIRLGRFDEAIEELEWARESFFDYRDVHYLAGQAYVEKKEWESALECFERASNMLTVPPTYLLTTEGLDGLAAAGAEACRRKLGSDR